jgi:hypothetical protein
LIAEDQSVTYPLGKDASGLIIYTPDGYMSAQLMAADRAAYASGHPHAGTTAEMSAAAAGYTAYSGPFLVDETTQTKTRRIRDCWSTDFHLGLTGVPLVIDQR